MSYIRTFATSIPTGSINQVVIKDTANNTSPPTSIQLSIDAQAPTVTATGTNSVIITVQDNDSKIWPAGIITKTVPLASIATPGVLFDETCGVLSPVYSKIVDTGALPNTQNKTVSVSGSQVVNYCVQDNAGNVTRGIYPNTPVACFAASNMNPVPNVTTYKNLLLSRINPISPAVPQYGYSFSENATHAACFRGILTNNINTLVTSQYDPRTVSTTLDWNSPAFLKNTNTSNTNGYYYFSGNSLSIDTFPTTSFSGPKAVIVEGGNIQINTDITNYSTGSNTLIIIARKNVTTNTG